MQLYSSISAEMTFYFSNVSLSLCACLFVHAQAGFLFAHFSVCVSMLLSKRGFAGSKNMISFMAVIG